MRNKATSGGRSGGRTGGRKSTGAIRKNDISKGKPGFNKSKPTENKNRPQKGERAGSSERGKGGFTRDKEDTGRFAKKKSFGNRPDSRGENNSGEKKPFNRDGARPSWNRNKEEGDRLADNRGERSGERRAGDYSKGRSEGRSFGEKKSYGSKTSGRGEGRPERKPFVRGGATGGKSPFNRSREEGGISREKKAERFDYNSEEGRFKGRKDDEGLDSQKRFNSTRNEKVTEKREGESDEMSKGNSIPTGKEHNMRIPFDQKENLNTNEIKVRKYSNERNDKGRYARHKIFDDKAKLERESRPHSESDSDESKEARVSGEKKERKPFNKGEFSKSRRAAVGGEEKQGFKSERKDGKSFRPRALSGANRNDSASYEPGRKKTKEEKMIRLNKFISNAGLCSRREADEMITAGVVAVNGTIITELGYKVNPTDEIRYNNEVIKTEKTVYLLLNKPKDFITTTDDPEERRTVMALVENACRERIYPVGRLDRATTGLLLFTNDGELTKKLTHPSGRVKKIYHVELDKSLKATDMKSIMEGLELEDGLATVDAISYVGEGNDKKQIGVELHSGKNRIVRRIFESLDYKVHKLDRVYFAGLTKKDLTRGKWRFLTDMELNMLKML